MARGHERGGTAAGGGAPRGAGPRGRTARAAGPPALERVDGGRYGDVAVLAPAWRSAPAGFVILFSDAAGWGASEAAAARALAAQGAFVLGIDTPRYLATLDRIDEPCHHLPGDAEGLARQIQRQEGIAAYRTPILAGIGEGGAVAAHVLAEAMPNTFAGAVALAPAAALPGHVPACGKLPATPAAMPGFWTVESRNADPAPARRPRRPPSRPDRPRRGGR